MATKLPEQKIKSLYQMLFEMATGNLAFRLPLEDRKDGLDSVILLLNQLAAKMQATFLEYGYVSPFYTFQNLVQLTLVLEADHTFKSCSANVQSILGYAPEKLVHSYKIEDIITRNSREYWNSIRREIEQQADFHSTIHLTFRTGENLLLPKCCTVSRLYHSNEIIITTLTTVLEELVYDLSSLKRSSKPRISETETMQQVHDYIMDNLDQPLLTLKELSKMFRINEFNLKKGFKACFHTGIHQFYNEHRLRRAHLMILQTTIPLKEIAYMNGFNSYLNFYKAFKKRFPYTPSELLRPPEDRELSI